MNPKLIALVPPSLVALSYPRRILFGRMRSGPAGTRKQLICRRPVVGCLSGCDPLSWIPATTARCQCGVNAGTYFASLAALIFATSQAFYARRLNTPTWSASPAAVGSSTPPAPATTSPIITP